MGDSDTEDVFVPISDLNGMVDFSPFGTHFKLVPGEIHDFDGRKKEIEDKLVSIYERLDEIERYQIACRMRVNDAISKIMSYQSIFGASKDQSDLSDESISPPGDSAASTSTYELFCATSEDFTDEPIHAAGEDIGCEPERVAGENITEIVSDLMEMMIEKVSKIPKAAPDLGQSPGDMGLGDFASPVDVEKTSVDLLGDQIELTAGVTSVSGL